MSILTISATYGRRDGRMDVRGHVSLRTLIQLRRDVRVLAPRFRHIVHDWAVTEPREGGRSERERELGRRGGGCGPRSSSACFSPRLGRAVVLGLRIDGVALSLSLALPGRRSGIGWGDRSTSFPVALRRRAILGGVLAVRTAAGREPVMAMGGVGAAEREGGEGGGEVVGFW